VSLFVDGAQFDCGDDTAALARQVCDSSKLSAQNKLMASDAAIELINALYNQGSITFDTG